MDEYSKLLTAHTEVEEQKFDHIVSILSKHVDGDYPRVLERLDRVEHLLHEISGGMKVLRVIGWFLSASAATFIFFKDHLFHLGK